MAKQSAGILLYQQTDKGLEVLLAHPGSPFWAKKDAGFWSIPKGEFTDEEPLAAALREFEEETGNALHGPFLPLPAIKQKGGKVVHAFALEGDFDPSKLKSNTFEMEWPPKSGRKQAFPEIDKVAWFTLQKAREMILPSQGPLLESLEEQLSIR